MAMNKSALATTIENALITLYTTAESSPMSKETFAAEMGELIADSIVDEIVNNLEVTVTAAQSVAILPPPSGDYTTTLLDGTGAPVTGSITTPSGGSVLKGTAE